MTLARVSELRTRARGRILDASGNLSAMSVWSLTALIGTGLAHYHTVHEGWWETIIFAGAITATLVAVLTLFSRRILFSTAIVSALVVMIVTAADIKRHYIEMVLHAYDVVFYLTSFSTLSFLLVDHKLHLLAIVGSFVATATLGKLAFAYDSSRVPRFASACLAVLCAATAFWASTIKGERAHTLFYWDNLYLSSF